MSCNKSTKFADIELICADVFAFLYKCTEFGHTYMANLMIWIPNSKTNSRIHKSLQEQEEFYGSVVSTKCNNFSIELKYTGQILATQNKVFFTHKMEFEIYIILANIIVSK